MCLCNCDDDDDDYITKSGTGLVLLSLRGQRRDYWNYTSSTIPLATTTTDQYEES